jgi:predicted RNA-binding protein with TRAM domain
MKDQKRVKRGKEREVQVYHFEEHEEGMMRRGWLRDGGYVLLG